jgi:hypothetical protein
MNSIPRISAITMLGLALIPGSAVSQQRSLKEQLVGTWTFVSSTTKNRWEPTVGVQSQRPYHLHG